MSRHLVALHFRGDGAPARIDASLRDLFQRIRKAIFALLATISSFFSTAFNRPNPNPKTPMNYLGPQSLRPLPRWYHWHKSQNRWRRFDTIKKVAMRNDKMVINNALETWSKNPTIPYNITFLASKPYNKGY